MGRFFRYLSYRAWYWKWYLTRIENPIMGKKTDAFAYISFLLFFNLLGFIAITYTAFGNYLPAFFDIGNGLIVILLIITLISYFIFTYGDKHQNIVDEFQKESEEERDKGTLKIRLYLFFTFAIPIALGLFLLYHKIHPINQ